MFNCGYCSTIYGKVHAKEGEQEKKFQDLKGKVRRIQERRKGDIISVMVGAFWCVKKSRSGWAR